MENSTSTHRIPSRTEKSGHDASEHGVNTPCRVYTSTAVHKTIQRACAVLGLGRRAVALIPADRNGRICTETLRSALAWDAKSGVIQMAIVANAGTTDTGAIDPIAELAQLADQYQCWLHVDGAYGLPGMLDPKFTSGYEGLEKANSIVIDPHKWLGAPVGIGATFVADKELLRRAFAQGEASYLEGVFLGDETSSTAPNSMDSMGVPYSDFGIELSAPNRGAVVWALLQEIGLSGLKARICRHNSMAQYVADRARIEPQLELLIEPSLSICCFRYVDGRCADLNQLNRQIHRQLVHNGVNIPSTTMIGSALAIRPCFIGARTQWQQAEDLVAEVLDVGRLVASRTIQNNCTVFEAQKAQ